MNRAFVSYARADGDIVRNDFLPFIEEAGFEVWIDELGMEPGTDWQRKINCEIQASDCVVAFVSHAAVQSPNVIAELHRSIAIRVPLIPIKIDDVSVAHIPNLRDLQFLDYADNPLAAAAKLIGKLRGIRDGKEVHRFCGEWGGTAHDVEIPGFEFVGSTYRFAISLHKIGGTVGGQMNVKRTDVDQHQEEFDAIVTNGLVAGPFLGFQFAMDRRLALHIGAMILRHEFRASDQTGIMSPVLRGCFVATYQTRGAVCCGIVQMNTRV